MKTNAASWTIVGQGLAGTCLAWALWRRGVAFTLVDSGIGGSSRIAAGMVNPLTGKNFEPSWRIGEFLPEALEFYAGVEAMIHRKIWHPFPVLRLASSKKEWTKILSKFESPEVAPWVKGIVPCPPSWAGAVEVRGGGRVDTRAFLDGSRDFFERTGHFQVGCVSQESFKSNEIRCEGASGLMTGRYGAARCAKGEILTIRSDHWDEGHIRIGAGGWLVPQGDGIFKVGSTYEWSELNKNPTEKARIRIEEIARRLGGELYEVTDQEAEVRPILRRSQPLIGPLGDSGWMLNGLGSKGTLYAPGMARRLSDWLVDGTEPEPEVDIRVFLKQSTHDESHGD